MTWSGMPSVVKHVGEGKVGAKASQKLRSINGKGKGKGTIDIKSVA